MITRWTDAPPTPAAPRALRSPRWVLGLLLVLTFSTGAVDAVGYLGLDRVFTGNMTGNVVILGMAVTGAAELPVLGPVLALVAFLLGAAVAGRVLRRAAVGWTGHASVLLAAIGLVLGALTVVLAVADVRALPATGPGPAEAAPPALLAVTGLLGLVMGVQAAVARRLAVADLTTVVVTSTLVGLAGDSRLAGGTGPRWARRLGAVMLLLAGAAAGAALLRWHLAAGVGLSAVLIMAVAGLGHRFVRIRGADPY